MCPVSGLWRRISACSATVWPSEDGFRGSAPGPSAGVGAFGVVVAEVSLKVEAEPGLFGDQVARERRLPAFVQDRLLHPLDAAIGLRPTSSNEAVLGTELGDVWPKVAERNSEALSLITRSSFQPRSARSAATWRARALVHVAEGFRRVTWRVAQV
jgi:hypothetical protein